VSRKRVTWTSWARGRLVASLSDASRRFPAPDDEDTLHLHDARKSLKTSASVARLFAPIIGPEVYFVIGAVDSARRRVGAARDLEVMPGVLGSLGASQVARDCLMRAIGVERGRLRGAAPANGIGRFRDLLAEAADRTQAWDLGEEEVAPLLASLKATYRAGLKLGRRAFVAEDADDLHDLRGRVIDLFHQSELFQAAWPPMFSAELGELHRLRTALGDHNDLTTLGEFALSCSEAPREVAGEIVDCVLAKRGPIERRARAQFERLYAERPGAFMRRMGAYLAHPRKHAS
jgi:CHAD domain-containing protein